MFGSEVSEIEQRFMQWAATGIGQREMRSVLFGMSWPACRD